MPKPEKSAPTNNADRFDLQGAARHSSNLVERRAETVARAASAPGEAQSYIVSDAREAVRAAASPDSFPGRRSGFRGDTCGGSRREAAARRMVSENAAAAPTSRRP